MQCRVSGARAVLSSQGIVTALPRNSPAAAATASSSGADRRELYRSSSQLDRPAADSFGPDFGGNVGTSDISQCLNAGLERIKIWA